MFLEKFARTEPINKKKMKKKKEDYNLSFLCFSFCMSIVSIRRYYFKIQKTRVQKFIHFCDLNTFPCPSSSQFVPVRAFGGRRFHTVLYGV